MTMARLKNWVTDRANQVAAGLEKGGSDPMQNPAQREELINTYSLTSIALAAQTILFSSEQARVFADLAGKYAEALDYKLPFPQTLIEFTEPVEMQGRALLGIALSEDTFSRAEFDQFAKERGMLVIDQGSEDLEDNTELHYAIGVYQDGQIERIGWRVDNRKVLFDLGTDAKIAIKNLAIACIGYINCENVEIERQAADEKVNAKRAKKGKRLIEPYYICRVRGVTYGEGGSQRTGGKHGVRYDVRGHFRRLETKTIWVRGHQRGLANELYVPKVYQVDAVERGLTQKPT
jgi:hypothetical protein